MAASGGPNTAQAFAPSRLRVYVAPLGTTMPIDSAVAMATTFYDLGFLEESGVTFNEDKTTNQVFDYEGNLVREVVTRRVYTIAGTLLQMNSQLEALNYGGGVTTVAGAVSTFTPPAGRTNTPYAVVLEWVDGAVSTRYLIPKATSSTGAQRPFAQGVVQSPISLLVTATNGVAPWTKVTSDVTSFPALP
jgi:hypothetical protein